MTGNFYWATQAMATNPLFFKKKKKRLNQTKAASFIGNCVDSFVCLFRWLKCHFAIFKQEVIVMYFHVSGHLERGGDSSRLKTLLLKHWLGFTAAK